MYYSGYIATVWFYLLVLMIGDLPILTLSGLTALSTLSLCRHLFILVSDTSQYTRTRDLHRLLAVSRRLLLASPCESSCVKMVHDAS